MCVWTDEDIRKAASWQAFKLGREMLNAGRVTQSRKTEQGWSGVVKAGARAFRCGAVMRSVTDVEVRCSCPANQSSGEFCAHAVAVGLAVLQSPVEKSVAPEAGQAAGEVALAKVAWRVALPRPWRKLLQQGRLAIALSRDHEREPAPADERLGRWLASQSTGQVEAVRLNLAGAAVLSFLESVIDHPSVEVEGGGESVAVLPTGRLVLSMLERNAGQVQLVVDAEVGERIVIDGAGWCLGAQSVQRIGVAGEGGLGREWQRLITEGAVRVELSAFMRQLDQWQEVVVFPSGCWLESMVFVPAEVAFELTLDGSSKRLTARLRAKYGDDPWVRACSGEVESLPRLEQGTCVVRHHQAEQAAVARLVAAGFVFDDADQCWLMRDEQRVMEFLCQDLVRLGHSWSIRESAKVTQAREQVTMVEPSFEVVTSGEDWLECNLKFKTSAGNELSRQDLSALLRGAGRSKRVLIKPEWEQVFEPLLAELDVTQVDGRYRASAAAAEVIQELCEKGGNLQKVSNQENHTKFHHGALFEADLRPYQEQGVRWLWDRIQRYGGALLADDMGLGKTIQTIALTERLLEEDQADNGVALVVMTTSLLGNWQAEWARFAVGRRVWVMHGTQRDRLREQIRAGDVVVTTYGTLARDRAWHLQQHYRLVVADEASLMRNPDTDHAKVLGRLQASARVALTGTPVENGVKDLWSIFRFIQPGWLGKRGDFDKSYGAMAGGQVDVGQVERLRLKVGPFLLRRTKEQVAADLPAKWVIDEYCDLTADQQGIYRGLLEQGRRQVDQLAGAGQQGAARMQVLTALLRLRQSCGDLALLGDERFASWALERRSAKMVRLMELLEEARGGGHRVLVFSQFQKQLVQIEQALQERGMDSLRLDGQTRNRQQMVDRFQSPDGPGVFLISLKAGGYGLNLTAADTVIHFDPWWNPAAEAQATDRAHRIGQLRPVTVYRLLTRGTVEEKVVRLQARKRQLAAIVDEAGAGDAGGWSTNELESLLGQD